MKQKTFFKILIVSMVLVLAMIGIRNFTYAETHTNITSTTTGTITVDGLEEGVSVSIYQLTTVNYNNTAGQPESTPYTWVSAVSDWLETTPEYSTYTDIEVFYAAIADNSSDASAFYGAVLKAIQGGELVLSAKNTNTSTGATVTFSGVEMGTYLVVMNGTYIYAPAVANLVPTYDSTNGWVLKDVTVSAKGTEPTINKYVTNTTLQKDNYNVTDTIQYTIIADVPTYADGATTTNYYIGDKLSSTLALNESTIEVYGVNGTSSTKLTTSAYTLTTSSATRVTGTETSVTFLLNFNYSAISEYSQIKVVYRASLNQNVSIVEGNTNTAYLDYTNNPYSATTTYSTAESTATVYTYGIELTKKDSNDGTVLSGAEFTLKDKDKTLLYFVEVSGVYYLSSSGVEGASETLVSGADGKVTVYGLDDGTYYLDETKAPDGYNISTKTEKIVLTDSNPDGILDGDEDGILAFDFTNRVGFSLPITGSVGTVIFAIIGIVFIGLGIVVLVIPMRKRNNK